MPSRVRVTAAVCENCGPCKGLRLAEENYRTVHPWPVTRPASRVRDNPMPCSDCGGQVRVATEPVEEEQ